MFIFSNFIGAVAHILDMILTMFFWAILIRALLSWVNPDPYNSIVQFLMKVTEPILEPFRRFVPMGFIDISPILAALAIYFLKMFVVASLADLSVAIR